MKNNKSLGPVQKTVVGVQFLFVAFGSTVLVPLLVGLDPSVALFTAGIGTLIFHLVTKGKVPIFLGSSFAFIAPIIKATELYGLPGTLCGLAAVGAVYGIMSTLVRFRGVGFIARLFPPVVVGPVIMLIGLSLAGTGVNMAKENWLLAIIALLTTIVVSLFGKGLLRLIPIFFRYCRRLYRSSYHGYCRFSVRCRCPLACSSRLRTSRVLLGGNHLHGACGYSSRD